MARSPWTAASPGNTTAGFARPSAPEPGVIRSTCGRCGARSPARSYWCAAATLTSCPRRSPSGCSTRTRTRASRRSRAPATRFPVTSPSSSRRCSRSFSPADAAASDLAIAQPARRLGTHLLHGASLLVGVALLGPRVGVYVVAVLLPESGWIDVEELEGAEPLRALPEVELGQDQPERPAVVGLEVAACVLERSEERRVGKEGR